LIPSVIDTLKPLEQNFNVITLSEKNKASQKRVLLLTTIKQNKWQKKTSLCVLSA
jgi:hypothetical protein